MAIAHLTDPDVRQLLGELADVAQRLATPVPLWTTCCKLVRLGRPKRNADNNGRRPQRSEAARRHLRLLGYRTLLPTQLQ